MTTDAQERVFIHQVLRKIRQSIPIDDNGLLISQFYRIVKKLADNPTRKESWQEAENYVNSHISRALTTLEQYERMEVPLTAQSVHLKMTNAFAVYYEGLCESKEYLTTHDTNQLIDALSLIFQADQLMLDADNYIGSFIKGNPVSTLL